VKGCDEVTLTISGVVQQPYEITIQLAMNKFELSSLSFSPSTLPLHFAVSHLQNSPNFSFGIGFVQRFSGFNLNGFLIAWITSTGFTKLEKENENGKFSL